MSFFFFTFEPRFVVFNLWGFAPLARLLLSETRSDCVVGQSWQLVFAMSLTGIIFLVWVMIMAYQVFVNS